jgi:drug/metabolite transporter (DMT)-like permease
MSTGPDFWFPAKRYGWGWGLPVRWQGWLVFAAYLALLLGGLYYFKAQRSAAGVLVYVLALTAVLIVIIAIKGERPLGWRWGGGGR